MLCCLPSHTFEQYSIKNSHTWSLYIDVFRKLHLVEDDNAMLEKFVHCLCLLPQCRKNLLVKNKSTLEMLRGLFGVWGCLRWSYNLRLRIRIDMHSSSHWLSYFMPFFFFRLLASKYARAAACCLLERPLIFSERTCSGSCSFFTFISLKLILAFWSLIFSFLSDQQIVEASVLFAAVLHLLCDSWFKICFRCYLQRMQAVSGFVNRRLHFFRKESSIKWWTFSSCSLYTCYRALMLLT